MVSKVAGNRMESIIRDMALPRAVFAMCKTQTEWSAKGRPLHRLLFLANLRTGGRLCFRLPNTLAHLADNKSFRSSIQGPLCPFGVDLEVLQNPRPVPEAAQVLKHLRCLESVVFGRGNAPQI
jgi:hypothetical protein